MKKYLKTWCMWLGGAIVAFLFIGVGGGLDMVFALPNPLGTAVQGPGDIPKLIGMILRTLFGIIGVIALVMFIYGGALWMMAFGEEQKIKRGWDTMIWAAIGLIVIFGSYAAVDFILKAILGS